MHRKNEFTDFCNQILEEAEENRKDAISDENKSFIDILLKNKNVWSSEEIQDEVSTLILSVSQEK